MVVAKFKIHLKTDQESYISPNSQIMKLKTISHPPEQKVPYHFEMSSYLTYKDTLETIHSSMTENHRLLKVLRDYFGDFGQGLNTMKDALAGLPAVLQNNEKPEKKAVKGNSIDFESIFSALWHRLAEDCMNPMKNFEEASIIIRDDVGAKFAEAAKEYGNKASVITQKGKELMQNLQTLDEQRMSAYKIYENAAQEVKDAFTAKSPKLAEIREAFVKAQTNAVNLHNKVNDERASTATKIEILLSEFEGLELWRVETIRRCLADFAKALESIARNFEKNSAEIKQSVEKINPRVDIDHLRLNTEIKNPASDDRFQLVPIIPLASQYADLSLIFKDEMKNGGKFVKSKQDYVGTSDQLNLKVGEIVIVLEECGEMLRCKNINESIGFVPCSIVEPHVYEKPA